MVGIFIAVAAAAAAVLALVVGFRALAAGVARRAAGASGDSEGRGKLVLRLLFVLPFALRVISWLRVVSSFFSLPHFLVGRLSHRSRSLGRLPSKVSYIHTLSSFSTP